MSDKTQAQLEAEMVANIKAAQESENTQILTEVATPGCVTYVNKEK